MDLATPGFLDALSIVGASNSAPFLRSRLRRNALVEQLATRHSEEELQAYLRGALQGFAQTKALDVQGLAKVYVFCFALLAKVGRQGLAQDDLRSLLLKSGVPWMKEVLALERAAEQETASTYQLVRADRFSTTREAPTRADSSWSSGSVGPPTNAGEH